MNKKLIVKQEEPSDCGICSLLSIIRYYKGNISLEQLRISSLTNREGVTALNLINCAIQYGFDAVGKRLDKIPINELPCIAHLKINNSLSHFVVIYSIKDNKVCLMDPSVGYKEISLKDFYKVSTNIYLLIKPKCSIIYQSNSKNLSDNTRQSIFQNKKTIFKIILLNYIYLFLSIMYSYYISFLLNNYFFVYIVLFFILLTSSNLLIYLINDNMNKFTRSVSFSLLSNIINHIFNLPLNYIHIKDSNVIVKNVLDLDGIKESYIGFIIVLITNVLIILITSFILSFIKYQIIYFIILGLIGYILISYFFKIIHNKADMLIDSNNKYNNSLLDYISGLESIKHNTSERYYSNKLIEDYNNNMNCRYLYDKSISKYNFLKQSYILSIEFFLNIYLLYNVINNNISLSYLFVVNFLFKLIVNSIVIIGNNIPNILYQRKIIIKVNDIYNIQEEDSKIAIIDNNSIRISGLKFSYNNYKNILNNINLNIKQGDKLIIKGESGSGKSTLCKILNKEYLNYQGNIFIGNNNYKDLSVLSIRNIISYTSQNEKIFHGTIRDNILMGHEIDIRHFEEVIKVCEIERIIKNKPYGLDTYLFGAGDELSGGERQLIFLARALVLNKNILILDETLSEVNDSVENKILKKLFKLYKNKTIIYVSHKNKKEYFRRTIYV